MNERQWLEAAWPPDMLEFLSSSGRASLPKATRFNVACCRRVWSLLTDQRSRCAVEVADRFAEGEASLAEVEAALAEARAAGVESWTGTDWEYATSAAHSCIVSCIPLSEYDAWQDAITGAAEIRWQVRGD